MPGPLQCVVVTPERAVLDETVDFVALPMFDGEVGILPGRAALIGRLGYGELRTKRGNQVARFFVDGGFAQVRANVVTVLTPRALKAEDIVPEKTAEALVAAQVPGKTPEQQDAQLRAQERARAQLRIARKGGEESF
jgi:F-type H+-transporting ATPase subunit epsilon